MNAKLRITRRIYEELEEIDRVAVRVQRAWKKAQTSSDDAYIDSVALNLHGIYNGLEHIFVAIAKSVNGRLPDDEHRHESLLKQMAHSFEGVRPAVISMVSLGALDEYRKFRHVIRNVYAHNLIPSKMKDLVEPLDQMLRVKTELHNFADFLEELATDP